MHKADMLDFEVGEVLSSGGFPVEIYNWEISFFQYFLCLCSSVTKQYIAYFLFFVTFLHF